MTESQHGVGQEPKASPAVRGWAILLGIALTALSGAAVRDAWLIASSEDHSSQRPWLTAVTDLVAIDGVEPWMLWAGAGSIAVGVFFLVIALRPQQRTHLCLNTTASGWTRAVDVARFCSATARRVPGVFAARTTATRKRVLVHVNGDVEDPDLARRVEDALGAVLDQVRPTPQLSVIVERVQEVEAGV